MSSTTNIIKDAQNRNITEILITHPDGIRESLKKSYLNAFFSESEISSLPDTWALSSESEYGIIYLGYLFGLFYPITNNQKFFKVGYGLSISYTQGEKEIFLCDSFLVKINLKTKVNTGICNNKKFVQKVSMTGFGFQYSAHFTLWEINTDTSIIRILSADLSGTNAYDCTGNTGSSDDVSSRSLTSCNNFSLRKIDKANNVSIVPSGSYVDFISYTFKF